MEKEIKKFLKEQTKRTTAKLWGSPLTFKPALLTEIIGDGKQIIYVQTIDQRPAYWLIRIDSKTDIKDDEFDCEKIIEKLEDEFGRCSEDDYETEDEFLEKNIHYPQVHATGWSWGVIKNFALTPTQAGSV